MNRCVVAAAFTGQRRRRRAGDIKNTASGAISSNRARLTARIIIVVIYRHYYIRVCAERPWVAQTAFCGSHAFSETCDIPFDRDSTTTMMSYTAANRVHNTLL